MSERRHTRKPLAILVVLGTTLGCGGSSRCGLSGEVRGQGVEAGATDTQNDASPTTSDLAESSSGASAGTTFLVAAERGQDLLFVKLDAASATVQPFGVPVPHDSSEGLVRLQTSRDLSRVVLLLGPPGCCTGCLGSYRVLSGDTIGFHTLGPSSNGGGGVLEVSDDASLVWLTLGQSAVTDCTWTAQGATTLTFNGTPVYQTPPPPSDQAPRFGGFSPDGQWFLYRHDGGVLTRRTLDGTENTIQQDQQDANAPVTAHAGVAHIWASSLLLLGNTYPGLELVDTNGAPVTVSGFTPDQTLVALSAGDSKVYYASAGTLFRLDDRALTPIQAVPGSFDVNTVVGTTPGNMLLAQRDAKTWVATRANGQVLATFTPLPTMTPPPPSGADISTSVILGGRGGFALTDALSSVLFDVYYDQHVASDLDVTLAFYRELWTFDQNGSSRVSVVEEIHNPPGTIPGPRTLDSFAISPAADYVAHVGAMDHALSVIDARTGLSRKVSSDLVFSGFMAPHR